MTNLNCCTYLIWMLQLFLCCVLLFVCLVDVSFRVCVSDFRHTNRCASSRHCEEEISGFYFIARFYTTVIWMVAPHTHTHTMSNLNGHASSAVYSGVFLLFHSACSLFSLLFFLWFFFSSLPFVRSSFGWHLKWVRISHRFARHKINPHKRVRVSASLHCNVCLVTVSNAIDGFFVHVNYTELSTADRHVDYFARFISIHFKRGHSFVCPFKLSTRTTKIITIILRFEISCSVPSPPSLFRLSLFFSLVFHPSSATSSAEFHLWFPLNIILRTIFFFVRIFVFLFLISFYSFIFFSVILWALVQQFIVNIRM